MRQTPRRRRGFKLGVTGAGPRTGGCLGGMGWSETSATQSFVAHDNHRSPAVLKAGHFSAVAKDWRPVGSWANSRLRHATASSRRLSSPALRSWVSSSKAFNNDSDQGSERVALV